MEQNAVMTAIWLGTGILLLLVLLTFLFRLVMAHNRRMVHTRLAQKQMELDHQEQLLHHSLDIMENERARFASDIHDGLIADLYRIKLAYDDPKLDELIAQCVEEARNISHNLSPPLLERQNTAEVLTDFLSAYENDYQLTYHIAESGPCNHPVRLKLHLLRIVQEVMTNITKHSSADKIDFLWHCSSRGIGLLIKENGQGFDPHQSVGLGLQNIALRARGIGAQYHFRFRPNSEHSFLLILKKHEKAPEISPGR